MPVIRIPTDIIENIIDHVTDADLFHLDVVKSSLSACALAAHAFYWPAMKHIFREIHLHIQKRELRGAVIQESLVDEPWMVLMNVMNDYSSPRLRQFSDLIERNPGLLRVIRSIHIYIASDYLRDGSRSDELWKIFEIMVQSKEMYIKSVSISSIRVHDLSRQWSWLDGISNTRIATLLELLQLVTEEISFKGIMIRFQRIGPLLEMFNSIGRISFSDIRVRKFPASVPPSYLDPVPSVLPAPGQGEPVGHKSLAIELCGWQDVLLMDELFQQSYSSLVTFELNVSSLGLFKSYNLRTDLAYLLALQVIRVKFSLQYYSQTSERRSGYGSVFPAPSSYLPSQKLVEAFNATHPSAVKDKPTSIKTIAISLTLHYEKSDLSQLYGILQAYNVSSNNPSPLALDLDEWKWSDFHPSQFTKKHSALQNLEIGLVIVCIGQHENQNQVTHEDYEYYGPERQDCEDLLVRLVRSRILGIDGNVKGNLKTDSGKDDEILRVNVIF